MEDTAVTSERAALELARILSEHRGGDVVVLDLSVQAGWTDYFVIATATSGTHLRGLARFVDDSAPALGLARLSRHSTADDDEWILVDFGTVVVHLMTERARSFYELEKLWFLAPATKIESPAGASA
ncbi:MAG TPA: ribosome silencing factor [Rectinemataceae bacterium]|nr:ribosome silencing factor [Rectinemataceae bacterium]